MKKTWKPILRVLLLFTIVILNYGCNQPAKVEILTSTPTATFQAETHVIATATKLPVAKTDFSCWPITSLRKGNDFRGSFVYAHYDLAPQGSMPNVIDIFTWNLSSFSTQKLNLDINAKKLLETGFFTSNELVKIDELAVITENHFILLSPQQSKIFPLPQNANINNALFRFRSLQDGRLLIDDIGNYEYKEGVGLTNLYYIFNPLTNTIAAYKIFLPNMYIGYRTGIGIYYSPDMKYVLYRSGPKKIDSNSREEQFTLFDIENNKVVWVTPPQNSNLKLVGGDPFWQTGTNMITAEYEDRNTGASKYYLVSLDGKISPLNDLENDPGSSAGMVFNSIVNGWSPDGRYLLSFGGAPRIWDNQTHTWYQPCLPDEDKLESPFAYKPLWFSDSSYLLVRMSLAMPTELSPFNHISKSYIIDVHNKAIYSLPENINSDFLDLNKGGENIFLSWMNWEIP